MSPTEAPAPTESLSVEQLALEARFFRVLGDPTRLQILEHLLEGEKRVGELVELLEMSQSRISNHLACLRWCGLMRTRREGRHVYYRVADPRTSDLVALARQLIAGSAEHILSCARI